MNINKKMILGAGLSVSFLTLPATEPVRKNNTSNVSHQLYDALIQTPAEAMTHVGHATQDVAAALANSGAGNELKKAGKQLAVEAPVKAGYAIKNGIVKAAHATAQGAKTAYEVVIKKPIHAVKHAAHEVIHSDFVQDTKEAALDVGHQFKDAGEQVADVAVAGAQKAYKILVKRPMGALKAAADYIVHPEDELHPDDAAAEGHRDFRVQTTDQICIAIIPKADDTCLEIGRVESLPLETHSMSIDPVQDFHEHHPHEVILQFEVDAPGRIELNTQPLSSATMEKIAEAFNAIKADLCNC